MQIKFLLTKTTSAFHFLWKNSPGLPRLSHAYPMLPIVLDAYGALHHFFLPITRCSPQSKKEEVEEPQGGQAIKHSKVGLWASGGLLADHGVEIEEQTN